MQLCMGRSALSSADSETCRIAVMAVAVPGRHHCLKAWLSMDKLLISMAKHGSACFSMKKHDVCIGIQHLRFSI